MIVDGTATLAIYSEVLTVAQITESLGLVPTEAHDRGETTRAGLAGRPLRAEFLTYQRTHWTLDAPHSGDPSDETGLASVWALVDALIHRAPELLALRDTCETIIWWHGSSDSSQGGFVIPGPLLADLAALGCDFYGTAYLDEVDDES